VKDGIELVKRERSRFVEALRERGFSPLPTEANFVLVPVETEAVALAARMRDFGVSVRAFPRLEGIGDALRISIGPPQMMTACLDALTKALA
jgi:histidinol-phosphate aminotransferase